MTVQLYTSRTALDVL